MAIFTLAYYWQALNQISKAKPMKSLLIVSGRSGSGKSSALNILEDLGYYCIDNLPLSLLPSLVKHFQQQSHIQRIGGVLMFVVCPTI